MKKLKSFYQFINEAAPAPSKPTPTVTPPPKEDEENKPATTTPPPATPPADGTTPPVDPNAVPGADGTTPPADPNAIPDPAAAGADPAAGGATGSTPSMGGGVGAPPAGGVGTGSAGTADAGGLGAAPTSSGMGGDDSGGAGLGEPLSDEGTDEAPKQGEGQEAEKKPEDYIPPVSKFNMVLMDKGAQWQQEYPDGGGVKEMTGYEVTWKDLNKWITQNNLANKKQDIAEYLMGENDDLDAGIKSKLKNAFTSKTLGDNTGNTEVEYDNDLTPYVQDINTILVDL